MWGEFGCDWPKNISFVKTVENMWNISHLWIITYAAAYKALSLVPTRAGPSHTSLTPLQKYDNHHRRDYLHSQTFIDIIIVIWFSIDPGWLAAGWVSVDRQRVRFSWVKFALILWLEISYSDRDTQLIKIVIVTLTLNRIMTIIKGDEWGRRRVPSVY